MPRSTNKALMARRAQIDTTNWRQVVRSQAHIKFDDHLKAKAINEVLDHGQVALAAQACGILKRTLTEHMKRDPEFATWIEEAQAMHAANVVEQLEREAVDGHEETIYSQKTGSVLGTKRVYETQMRMAVLKRYDPDSYSDRSQVDIRQTIGVLVAPAAMAPQDWIKAQQEANASKAEPDMHNLDAPPAAQALIEGQAKPG